MKITFLNGSPRLNNSSSKKYFEWLKVEIENLKQTEIDWQECTCHKGSISDDTDILIIAMPLYYDGLPSILISFLENFLKEVKKNDKYKKMKVYGLSNCGFIEGFQNRISFLQLQEFCVQSGINWCGGLGIGGGGMISDLERMPDFFPIKVPILNTIKDFAHTISLGDVLCENIFTQPNYPWIMYKISGEKGWKIQAKMNGLKPKELNARPLIN